MSPFRRRHYGYGHDGYGYGHGYGHDGYGYGHGYGYRPRRRSPLALFGCFSVLGVGAVFAAVLFLFLL